MPRTSDKLQLSDLLRMEHGDKLVLSNIQFEINSSELLESSFQELQVLKRFLLSDLSVQILIAGHTDNIGNEEYNLNLSRLRAESVKQWLIKSGVSADRLTCKGLGFSEPLNNNFTENNRQLNRRVEIVVLN